MTELPDLALIPVEQKDELIRFLFGEVKHLSLQVAVLAAELAEVKTELAELKAQRNRDSHNSSKSPSSDGLGKKTTSLRVASNKKQGGQVGHKNTTLKQVSDLRWPWQKDDFLACGIEQETGWTSRS